MQQPLKQETTMTNLHQDFSAFVESSRKFAEPALRFQALSAKATERFARHGFEAASQYLNFGFNAVHSALDTQDVNDLILKNTDLAKSVYEFNTKAAQELVKLATDVQADFNHWFEQSAPEHVVRVAKAAKAA
jgi:tRNA G18 (ribose-2'-O)-methylase SpoU